MSMDDVGTFVLPCWALAHKECEDAMEMAASLIAGDFGNMGRCAYLFRSRKAAIEAAGAIGAEIVIEIGNLPFLELVLDAEKGYGSANVAVDLVRTRDGQTACEFFSIVSVLEALRSTGGMGPEPA